jgi:outer membrane protein assembly factor BamB
VADGRVYIVRQQNPGQLQAQTNTLFAVNAITGATVWQHSFPGQNVVSAPAYYNGSVYVKVRTAALLGVGQNANNILRLDAASGAELANAATSGIGNLASYDQSPTVGNGVLIAQGTTGSVLAPNSILALDATTLKKKWEMTLDGATDGLYDFIRAPSIANDFVVACSGGRLRAWQLSTGMGDQSFFTWAQLACRGQPIVAGGRLIFDNPAFDYVNSNYFIYAYGPQ